MRRLLLAFAALLAACQAATSGNQAAASDSNAASLDGNAAVATQLANADTPISSDDPSPAAPQPDGPTADCPIIGSSDWHAHVDAMPGRNDNPRLIVSGKATVRSGGYRLALRMGAVAESYPVQVTVHLDVTPPKGMATQMLGTHEVHGSWRSEERVGSITIRCGSRVLARLSNIETAE